MAVGCDPHKRGVWSRASAEGGPIHITRQGRVPVLVAVIAILVGAWFGVARRANATSPGLDGLIIYRTGGGQLMTMTPDGGNQTPFPQGGTTIAMLPSWSPQGDRVAWAAASPKRALDVWVANADGSGLRNLTPTSSAGDRFPTWSPDETRFAFMSTRSKGIEIWTMNADGSSPLQLTNNVNIEDCCPDWSPAANRIAFESNRDGKFEIYTMDPNGANVNTADGQQLLRRHPGVLAGRHEDRIPVLARRQQ